MSTTVCVQEWSEIVAIDRHTRVVGWLKVALPLMALAILATLFLLGDRVDPGASLPYAEVDLESRAREPRMTAPSYAGITSDGAALTLTAKEARPSAEGPAKAQDLQLALVTPDGGTTILRAATAVMDQTARQLLLSGGVTVTTGTGYTVQSAEVVAELDRSGLESRGEVTATGPVGDIRADGMILRQDNGTPGAYVLVFKGGVRLVYQPEG